MRLPLDPGDVLGEGCWDTLKRIFAPVSSLWVGCFSALASVFLAEIIGLGIAGLWGDMGDLFVEMAWAALYAPFTLLLSGWSLVVVPMMGLVFYMMLRGDRDVHWLWMGCTLGVGLMVMNTGIVEVLSIGSLIAAWVVFAIIAVSIVVGGMFFRGWEKNVHAQHLKEVNAENELRRIEIEQAYGTKSFGQGNVQEMNETDDT